MTDAPPIRTGGESYRPGDIVLAKHYSGAVKAMLRRPFKDGRWWAWKWLNGRWSKDVILPAHYILGTWKD